MTSEVRMTLGGRRLAELVACAARVDRALLRLQRLTFLPGTEPGIEADVWLSRYARGADADGFVLDAKLGQDLRRDLLLRDPGLYDAAWATLRRWHAHVGPAQQLEEELLYEHAWLEHGIADRRKDARARIEEIGRIALKAMFVGRRTGIANWAARALPRLRSESMRQPRALARLDAASQLQLAGRLPTTLQGSDASWLVRVGIHELPRTTIAVGLRVGALLVGDTRHLPSDPTLQLPRTTPLVIEVQTATEAWERVEVWRDQVVELAIPREANTLRLRTLAGDEFDLQGAAPDRDGDVEKIIGAIKKRYVRELPQDQRGAPPPPDLKARYRDYVVAAHSHLVPFFPELQDRLLADVYVEVEVAVEGHGPDDFRPRSVDELKGKKRGLLPHEPGEGRGMWGRTVQALRNVLLDPRAGGEVSRVVVVGEPGAGKSTLARNLARTLAGEADGPLPLFLALSRIRSAGFDPFVMVAAEVMPKSRLDANALAELLRAEALAGRVVFLFDGLDEVDPQHIDTLTKEILELAKALPSPIAVLARPIAVEGRDLGRQFDCVKVQRLTPPRRTELVRCLLAPADANVFLAEVERDAGFAELCQNPLMLTMAAMVASKELQSRRQLPTRRGPLCDRAIDLLLRRGYGGPPKNVTDPYAARQLLTALSLQLHEAGGQSWTRKDLARKHLWAVRKVDADFDFMLKVTWGTNEKFLADIGDNAGVIGPHDGEQVGWRYLHRSLREYLVAERLAALGEAAWKSRIEMWAAEVAAAKGDTERERWGEVFLHLASLVADPLALVEAIRRVSPPLALRALMGAVTIEVAAGIRFALDDESVDGDFLRSLLEIWQVGSDEAEQLLWPFVRPDASTLRLGSIWYVLESVGRRPVREKFFAACGRPVDTAPKLDAVAVPAGKFVIGSPETEAERSEAEGPQHAVQVGAFWLCRTAVTNGDYRRFDPKHVAHEWYGVKAAELATHPVVNVSWWEAYLFCRWLGDDVRLPSEAERECACRAGTTTPFSFGENITPEQVNYNGTFPYADGKKGPYRKRTVPVGSLPANAWGLHEMHGNVDEWCQDVWHDNYEGAPHDGTAWEVGGSGYRVVRGGSWFNNARNCRSAYRIRWHPGIRVVNVGFRPASSSPDHFTTSSPDLRVQTRANRPK